MADTDLPEIFMTKDVIFISRHIESIRRATFVGDSAGWTEGVIVRGRSGRDYDLEGVTIEEVAAALAPEMEMPS